MTRIILFLLLIGLLSACSSNLAASPGSSGAPGPSNNASSSTDVLPSDTWLALTGTITQVGDRILVEEQPGIQNQGNKIVWTITDATQIFVQDGDQQRAAQAADLAIGQQVDVWAAGAVAASYPGQGIAARIVILPAAANAETWMAITGTITQINERVLVEEQPGLQDQGNKIWFTVPQTAQIFVQNGDQRQPATADDLTIGQQVQVWAAGPVLESYPAQGSAARIVILPAEAATPTRE